MDESPYEARMQAALQKLHASVVALQDVTGELARLFADREQAHRTEIAAYQAALVDAAARHDALTEECHTLTEAYNRLADDRAVRVCATCGAQLGGETP